VNVWVSRVADSRARWRAGPADPLQGSPSLAYGSVWSAFCPTEAEGETDDSSEDEDTGEAVAVMDGDEHHDPKPEQYETGYEPKG